jgi:hypothetical protein
LVATPLLIATYRRWATTGNNNVYRHCKQMRKHGDFCTCSSCCCCCLKIGY